MSGKPPQPAAGRPKARSRLRWIVLAVVGAALVGSALWFSVWGWRALNRPYSGWSGKEVVVEIPPESSATEALSRLRAAGVIENATLARAWLAWIGGERRLQAGEFKFERPASMREVLERVQHGDVLLHRLTVPEGLRLAEIARVIAGAGFGAEAEVRAALGDLTPVRQLDPAATDLEGYLFPETYWFPKGSSPAAIAREMVGRFSKATGANYAERARAVGLTVRQAVTLASLIEEETSVPAERPRVSRVFHNRLARKMALQCDPTVQYALHRAGRQVETLSRADLVFASPWNTYSNVGLPPGPICSPGLASLEAAVAPAAGTELYFVASPLGGHRFTSDLASHERAVQEWRRYRRSSR